MLRPLGVSFFVLTAVWDKILMSDNMTSKLGWGVHRCGLWRGIHMGWETFSKNTRFEIGVENRVKFWQDWWCGDQPLQLTFSVLYEISVNRGFCRPSLDKVGGGGEENFRGMFHSGFE